MCVACFCVYVCVLNKALRVMYSYMFAREHTIKLMAEDLRTATVLNEKHVPCNEY